MLRTAVIACIFGSITWQTGSAESFPYVAYVKDAVGIVRSGPGDKFYETDELPAGSAVEIYKHRDGQWCAIRPPQSSFSLVQAKDVAVTDNPQVLRVISSNAITRVGSNESDSHNVAYVKLHQGELLSVLDKIVLTNNANESQLWYKVAPPSGEFRWIHKDFLTRSKPVNIARATRPAPAHAMTATSEQTNQTSIRPQIGTDASKSNVIIASGSELSDRLREQPAGARLAADIDSVPAASMTTQPIEVSPLAIEPNSLSPELSASAEPIATSEAETQWVAASGRTSSPVSPSPAVTTETANSRDLKQDVRAMAEECKKINLALSAIVSEEISAWELAPLRQRAEYIAEHSVSPQVTAAGTKLLQRIQQFEAVQGKYMAASQSQGTTSSSAVGSGVVPASYEAVAKPTGQFTGRVASPPRHTPGWEQAQGWLMPVLTSRTDIPKFAITDDAGDILCFVTPNEQVDFSSAVRQRVQVAGPMTSLANLPKPHLTVQQIAISHSNDARY
ncbi:MAG: hypothetical protein KDA87_00710 [Planctomycetales bacterium]|nr:hypothetical protein [Planctomycetales bacterium]